MSALTARTFDRGVVSVGRCSEQGVVEERQIATHDYVALAFYTRGHASVVQHGARLELAAGDVMLVPAGEPHRLVAGRDPSAWGIGFYAACYALSELAPLLDPFQHARAGASPVVHIPEDRQVYLEGQFAELHREVTHGARSAHSDVVQKSLLGLILAEVKRAAAFSPAAELQPTVVGEALQFIEVHCLEPISLRDVARAVRRSPAHVTTMLRRATGKSAVVWITAGRMAEARSRLAHTDEFVEIIAERVGYADATHFIRTFRRVHGATPAAWRAGKRRASLPSP
ncbi:MAG: AraC family transcriptional regulator [Myxococcota bacterium]|nr:AraC family transcriptional regulator [Myxococcota bacterium]